jgi:hypothetical protein
VIRKIKKEIGEYREGMNLAQTFELSKNSKWVCCKSVQFVDCPKLTEEEKEALE